MRCKGCPYESYDYQEGYPTCRLFGVDDEFVCENAKGEVGCRFNCKTLKAYERGKELEETIICKQMGDFVKWYEEAYGKEGAK